MDDESQGPKPVIVDATAPVEQPDPQQPADPNATTNSVETEAPAPESEEEQNKKEGIKGIFSTIAILVIAPLIALSLTLFVFQSYEVDGPSMETTLQDNDRLIVYKLPKTVARLTGRDYLPKRTDIIIFTRNEGMGSRQLVKRVIALPGERVVLKNGVMTVYNNEKPEGFQPDKVFPYGKVITTTAGDVDVVVPEDSVFVCGDNRPQSLDSRAFGPVPLKDITGKLSLRVYPFGSGQKF